MFATNQLCFKDFIQYDDVEIIQGKIHFIMGASGTGKSTLLKLFNKMNNYSSGEIYYKGKSIQTYDSIMLRREVKLIAQTPFLFRGSILDNFIAFYEYCERRDLSEEKMKRFLQMVEYNVPLESKCDTLSGGEKQRVYMAICLSMEAEVIMLDEPTSSLDRALAVKVLENIITYVRTHGKTLVVVSHDEQLANEYAEVKIRLTGGHPHE